MSRSKSIKKMVIDETSIVLRMQLIYEIEGLTRVADNCGTDVNKLFGVNKSLLEKIETLNVLQHNIMSVIEPGKQSDNNESEIASSVEFEEESDADITRTNYTSEENCKAVDGKVDEYVCSGIDEIKIVVEPDVVTLNNESVAANSDTETVSENIEAVPHVNDRHFPFTLNDTFRFKRELFNGSSDDFVETQKILAQFDDFKSARCYLIKKLGRDEDDADMAAFLEIIKQAY